MKAKQKITPEQAAAGFDRGVTALDEIRAMQIAEGLRLESAKAHVSVREYDHLERKYGKEHPRTMAMKAKIELGRSHIQAIVMEYATASTPRPDAGQGWAVDGFVRTADGEPVPGVTVAAYDRKGVWHQELGYACTDEKGYFSMVAEKLPDKELRVYMHASYGEKMLKSNENRLAPAAGSTDRIEIIIEKDGKGDCMPPSDDKSGEYPWTQSSGGKPQPKDTPPNTVVPAKEPQKETPKGMAKDSPGEKTGGGVMATGDAANKGMEESMKGLAKKLKEEPKINVRGGIKKPVPKKRGK